MIGTEDVSHSYTDPDISRLGGMHGRYMIEMSMLTSLVQTL